MFDLVDGCWLRHGVGHLIDDLDGGSHRNIICTCATVFGSWMGRQELVVLGNPFEILDRSRHTDSQRLNGSPNTHSLRFKVGLEFANIDEQATTNVFEFGYLGSDWFTHCCGRLLSRLLDHDYPFGATVFGCGEYCLNLLTHFCSGLPRLFSRSVSSGRCFPLRFGEIGFALFTHCGRFALGVGAQLVGLGGCCFYQLRSGPL